jgi:hypothetical protein
MITDIRQRGPSPMIRRRMASGSVTLGVLLAAAACTSERDTSEQRNPLPVSSYCEAAQRTLREMQELGLNSPAALDEQALQAANQGESSLRSLADQSTDSSVKESSLRLASDLKDLVSLVQTNPTNSTPELRAQAISLGQDYLEAYRALANAVTRICD